MFKKSLLLAALVAGFALTANHAEAGPFRRVAPVRRAVLPPYPVARRAVVAPVVAAPMRVLAPRPFVYGAGYHAPIYGGPIYGGPVYGGPVYAAPIYQPGISVSVGF